jgi:succinate dehydrogenase / fumarate reductase membrane anchor subunit
MLIPTIALIVVVAGYVGRPYAEVVEVLSSPLVAILLLAFILLNAVHMRLGMQIIIEDYVHSEMPKFALLTANWMFSWAVSLASRLCLVEDRVRDLSHGREPHQCQ